MTLRALLGGDGPAADLFDISAASVTRLNSLELPASAEELQAGVRADVAEITALDGQAPAGPVDQHRLRAAALAQTVRPGRRRDQNRW